MSISEDYSDVKTPLNTSQLFSILHPMAKIIEGFKSKWRERDFQKYDIPIIIETPLEHFPILWAVRESGETIIQTHAYGEALIACQNKAARWSYLQNPGNYYLKNGEREKYDWYILEPKRDALESGIRKITLEEARNLYKSIVEPYAKEFIEKYGPYPKRFKVKVKFHNITISRLKELLSDSRELNTGWAGTVTIGESLRWILKGIHRCTQLGPDHHYDLYWNEGDKAFYFSEAGFEKQYLLNGAIKYHGAPDEGYQQNGSTQIEPSYGWARHT